MENTGVDWRIILKLIFEKWDRDTDWNDVAHNKDSCSALVNAVTNLRVP